MSTGKQATVDKVNSLANECKYNLAKPGFKPRTQGESEQFAFHTVECKQSKISFWQCRQTKPLRSIKFRCESLKTAFLLSFQHSRQLSTQLLLQVHSLYLGKRLKSHLFQRKAIMKNLNNRPVSLLPTSSKACEKVALNQFMAFSESKQRLSIEQIFINRYTPKAVKNYTRSLFEIDK